jgi:superfamily I DNA and RNA helicase
MQKLYIIAENVSNDVYKSVTKLHEDLKKENINSYVYCGYPLINIDNDKSFMKGLAITEKGVFILYKEEKEQSDATRDFLRNIMDSPELSKEYFNGNIKIFPTSLKEYDNIIEIIKQKANSLSISIINQINELVQHIQNLTPIEQRATTNSNTLGYKIKQRETQTKTLDETQFETLYKNNNDNLRIRGLAGSGKTILLVKKLAYLHFKDREKRLAYVFYTKSLKQYIVDMFKSFYKEFERNQEPDMSKISIVHAWGNSNVPGFYSIICSKYNLEYKTLSDCDFETACDECINALPAGRINMYDYVFIDEAQDFRINFYKLVRKSLNPLGKLIYAYDELQTLNENTSKMPTKQEIFGEDECLDKNLKFCYRSPNEILVAAHALGLGIYHKNKDGNIEFINYVDDLDTLKSIGYFEAEGKLKPNCQVTLKRENLIENQDYEKIETYKGDAVSQYNFVTDKINDLIQHQDVCSEDILIIDLDTIKVADNFNIFKGILWQKTDNKGNHIYNTNLVNKEKALSFRLKDSIPYTTIFRAKGNEANIVFIVNANKLNVVEMYNRNRIFTAMTRAKFKVYILGDGSYMDSLISELEDVKEKGYTLQFKCLSESEQKEFKNKLYQDSKKADDMRKVLEILNKYKDDSLYIKILEEQGNIDKILQLFNKENGE